MFEEQHLGSRAPLTPSEAMLETVEAAPCVRRMVLTSSLSSLLLLLSANFECSPAAGIGGSWSRSWLSGFCKGGRAPEEDSRTVKSTCDTGTEISEGDGEQDSNLTGILV